MTDQNTEHSWWDALRETRELKGISLNKAADDTRIAYKYLQSLEQGDLLQIPAVYDKLFFKSYLKYLALEEEIYYPLFIQYRQQVRVDKTTRIENYSDKEQNTDARVHLKNLRVILPVLIIFLVIWYLVNNTLTINETGQKTVPPIDVETIVKEMEKQEQTPADTVQAEPENKQEKFTVNLVGKKQTWFRVIRDSRDTLEYTLKKGASINIPVAEKLEFLIGRASGLSLKVNGITYDSLGTYDQVVRYMLVDSTGIVTKRLIQPKSQPELKAEVGDSTHGN